ncbi:MAG TPA: T9SS type A sorting domain-containing protein, partial [Bacteroidia bacterium]|nr:T9SS type A sorting domain-containing protein [Bacteroidia bacterium]
AISLYPNPAADKLNIEFNLQNPEGETTIKINDLLGKEVLTTSTFLTSNKTITIDINTLAKGVYFIQVVNDTTTKVFKFIKQ